MPKSVVEKKPDLITEVEAVRSAATKLITLTAELTAKLSIIITL
jgi:hypothetical protein